MRVNCLVNFFIYYLSPLFRAWVLPVLLMLRRKTKIFIKDGFNMFRKRKENREKIVELMENILLYNEAGDYEIAYSYVRELDKLIKYIPYSDRESYMAVCEEVSNGYMLLLLHKCKDNIDSCKELCEDIIEICKGE